MTRNTTKRQELDTLRIDDAAMFRLCDPEFQNDVHHWLLAAWVDDKGPEYRGVIADLIDDEVVAPLRDWERRILEGWRGLDAREHYPAQRLRIVAEETARAIRQGQDDLKAMADDLSTVWTAFVAAFAAHRMHADMPAELEKAKETAETNRGNRQGKGKTAGITADRILELKSEFVKDKGLERGWKKYASGKLEVSVKALNKLLPADEMRKIRK